MNNAKQTRLLAVKCCHGLQISAIQNFHTLKNIATDSWFGIKAVRLRFIRCWKHWTYRHYPTMLLIHLLYTLFAFIESEIYMWREKVLVQNYLYCFPHNTYITYRTIFWHIRKRFQLLSAILKRLLKIESFQPYIYMGTLLISVDKFISLWFSKEFF